MATVLEMTRILSAPPIVSAIPGIQIRHYSGPADIEAWLTLRDRSFARERPGVRSWSVDDFSTEFLSKPWWRSEYLWFAECEQAGAIGSVALARRGNTADARSVVHWLMVDPRHRRRGIARLLLAKLEATVWERGQRQIWLETHTGWQQAEQFYRAMGYTEARPR
jgi:GNAT superfamily N-acetyltransferase